MAYVSISKGLVEDVKNTIDRLAAAELNTLPSLTTLTAKADKDDALRTKTNELLWGDLIDLEPRLTQYSKNMRVDLQVYYKHKEMDRRVEVPLPNTKVPCFHSSNSTGYSYLDFKVEADIHPVLGEIITAMVERHDVEERWKALKAQLVMFLEKCKSLNEAIKLWPDLRRHIPKEYLDRVETKVERSATAKSQAAEALKDIDMDALQTSVVLARMAGAKL